MGIKINCLWLLVELGINNIPHELRTDDGNNERERLISVKHSKLDVYRTRFQERFLEETKQYYLGESINFIQNNSVVEYMKKVLIFSSLLMRLLMIVITNHY